MRNNTIATRREQIALQHVQHLINKTNDQINDLNYFIKWAQENNDVELIEKYAREYNELNNDLMTYHKMLKIYNALGLINIKGLCKFEMVTRD